MSHRREETGGRSDCAAAMNEAKQRLLEVQAERLELERQNVGLRQSVDDLGRRNQICRAAMSSIPGGWMAVYDSALRLVTAGGDLALSGVDLSKRSGFGFEGVVAEADLHTLQDAARRALGGETVFLELRVRGADVEFTIRPIRGDEDAARHGMVIARDVTGHVRNERRLLASSEYLENVLDVSSKGAFELDVITGYARVSDRWNEITGRAQESHGIDRESFFALVHPDDLEATAELRRQFREGERDRMEMTVRMRTAEGGYRWVRIRMKLVAWNERGLPRRAVGTFAEVPPPRPNDG